MEEVAEERFREIIAKRIEDLKKSRCGKTRKSATVRIKVKSGSVKRGRKKQGKLESGLLPA